MEEMMDGLGDILAGLVPDTTTQAAGRPVLTLDSIKMTESDDGNAQWLHAPCRACGGIGRTYPDDEPCPCEPVARIARRLTLAQIPWKYRNAGPADLTDFGRAWIAKYERGGRGIRFGGESWGGKTHRIAATVRGLIERGISARFVSWKLWLADMKHAMGRESEMHTLIARISEPDVVAIDDVGRERGTEWEHEQFDTILERRILRESTLLLSTNLTDAELLDRLGDRVWSRLKHTTDPVVVPPWDGKPR